MQKSGLIEPNRILIDSWYAEHLSDFTVSFEDILRTKCPSLLVKLAGKLGCVRGLLLFWFGRSFDAVVTAHDHKGATEAMFLEAIFSGGRRRYVLLELLVSRPSGWRLLISPFWKKFVLTPAIRRSVANAQVLTEWEQTHYSNMFGIPEDRLRLIKWPLRHKADVLPDLPSNDSPIVMSSGRIRCDWETLFAAADVADWQLLVVCSKRDLTRVNRLNRNGKAHVLCNISREEHQACLRSCTVYVISVLDRGASIGHVRLSEAVRFGAPVISTIAKGLEGYLEDGVNSVLVKPGDPTELRKAIDELVYDTQKLQFIRRNAFEMAYAWTSDDYIPAIRSYVQETVAGIVDKTKNRR